jgi:hypothetical protein
MDELQRLIDAYPTQAAASVRSRLNVLMTVEQIHDPRVLPFQLSVLEDRREAEEVRIYVLQQLRGAARLLRPSDRVRVAKAAGNVLADTSGPELRLQAALALGDLVDVAGILAGLNRVCLAQDESIDLRYAAFTSIERAGPTPKCIALLRHMTADETLGLSARSVLSAWHVG